MTRDQIDALWQQAMHDAIAEGEQMTRYHFADLVAAAEREACAQYVEQCTLPDLYSQDCLPDIANEIRERGQE